MAGKKQYPKLSKETYVLYLLNKLSARTDKYRINKIAFLVEFAYIYQNRTELTDAEYAAINKGPVINDYKNLFEKMEKKGLLKVDGYFVRPLKDANVSKLDPETLEFIDEMVEKFNRLGTNDLIALTHSLDSYIITTKEEQVMGNVIDKSLANLDIYFDEHLDQYQEGQIPIHQLPKINRDELIEYGVD